MRSSHIRPAITYGAISLLVLVLATAASPAHNGRRVPTGRPLLVALPQRLTGVRDLAPGDRIERFVELHVRGKGRFVAVYLRTRVSRQSVLADPQRGHRQEHVATQMRRQVLEQPWQFLAQHGQQPGQVRSLGDQDAQQPNQQRGRAFQA